MGSRIVVTFEVMEQDRPVFMDVLGEGRKRCLFEGRA